MLRRFLLLSLGGLLGASAAADTFLGTLHLHDGCPLRGTLTRTETGYTLQNEAGQILLASERVAHVVRHGPASSQPAAEPVASRPVTPEPEAAPAEATDGPQLAKLADFARLSANDIKRLKVTELQINPPERVQGRLVRGRDGDPIQLLRARDPFFNPGDTPAEQIAAVVASSGYEFLEQIQMRGETQTFRTFRRGVLPIVIRGCARAGCHGGPTARHFRLPSSTVEAEAYNAFVVLDRIQSSSGPLLNRDAPEESVLLDFLLPADEAAAVHPEVPRTRLTPLFRNRDETGYKTVRAWIASLRKPRPDYELEADLPDWLE